MSGASTDSAVRRDEALRGLEHEIGCLLRRVRRGMAERAVQIDPALNGTSYTLLSSLIEFGPTRAADLAEMFALDKGAVSRVVHQLLELGLIVRSPDPHDGRASILAATEEAQRRVNRMRAQGRQQFGERLAQWDPADIAALARGLAAFNTAISD